MTCKHSPSGLDADELRARLGDKLAAFDRWWYGQTGAICDHCNALLVYEGDVRKFEGRR